MNINNTEILKTLSDAIIASGKKLSEIGKEPIFEYLRRAEVPKNQWEGIYSKLQSLHEPDRQSVVVESNTWHDSSWSEEVPDVNKKQPRKKVFSEIKKIAG